jgi:hypothetical protein
MREHLLIPDCQVKPGVPIDHLDWIGKYIVDKKPDVVINIGDFADMASLSSYDKGKRSAEGRRIREDLDATYTAMIKLMKPLKDYNARKIRNKEKQYKPELIFTLGNHEHRISRAAENDAALDGFLNLQELNYEKFGWKVCPFLDIAHADGIAYSHYFYNPMTGRPYGGQNIKTRLNNIGFSFSMGHQQGYDSGQKYLNNGRTIRGLVAGSCYLHDEDYIGPQANGHWRGVIYKHEVFDGNYDLMEVSLDFLCRQYNDIEPGLRVWEYMKIRYPELYKESHWLQWQESRHNQIETS